MSATVKNETQHRGVTEGNNQALLSALYSRSYDWYLSARRRASIMLLGLSATFVTSVLWHPPDNPKIDLCLFHALTGYPCPGCGMTRAFCALGHGELRRAIGFNALSPILFLCAIVIWMSALATVLNLHGARSFFARLRPGESLSKMVFLLVLVWWVARVAGGF